MDFQLTEEQILIQDMARSFSASELAPFSAKWDEKKFLDRNVFLKAAELGFMGIYTSEEYGGTALSRLDCALVFEQLAAGDVSHTAMITIHNMATWMIDRYSSDEIRKKYVPGLTSGDLIASYCLTEPGSGSDAASLSTKAEKVGNEYILNGTKTFISGAGWSDIYLVMARTSDQGAKGVSTFIVEKDAPGLSFGATEKKMGWNAQPTAQVIMEDCKVSEKNRVGAEGEGFKFAMSGLDGGRINIGACSLGGAQKALNASIKYTSERKQFGKFISDFQNTEFMLADMATELEASRMMIYRGADMIDKGIANVSAACAMAKRYSTDMCSKIADNALQLHGGYGYLSEYEIEQIVRDLRVHQILEGTNQIMRVIISRSLLRQ
ncbi:MAG: acyl-CoA dehydrogenase [Hellea sp.]|jgi:alkylation response protein AidB-like acyl-CoA dehydrogenase|nr:acyl-CoA dehydrogenase family protein [Hellea sp.]MBT3593797.1 acyl-CoA dehydrogenase [Hellea sp.]MBT4995706.1 acyl-CoA dehydrogenase [Hellea sp.]MBT5836545.1 acyl-CoA dehydrogenase [Hellea sp.]MDA8887751.1 acyl-CoA dehydrogenase family protein [Hellea sp.]MDB4844215.1 acyl-CoA dehydrogenase family protein [Hellea sp.]